MVSLAVLAVRGMECGDIDRVACEPMIVKVLCVEWAM
jgi:hypothetical protein